MEVLKDLIFGSIAVEIILFVLFIGWIVLLFKKPAAALFIVAAAFTFSGLLIFPTANNPLNWSGVFMAVIGFIVWINQGASRIKREEEARDAERRQARLVANEVAKALAAHGLQPSQPSPPSVPGVAVQASPEVAAQSPHFDANGMPIRPAVATPVEPTEPSEANGWGYVLAYLGVAFLQGVGRYFFAKGQDLGWVDLVAFLAALFIIFAWYRNDADARRYVRSGGLNVAIVLLAIIAVPYYLFQTRKGSKAVLGTVVFLLAIAASTFCQKGGIFVADQLANPGKSTALSASLVTGGDSQAPAPAAPQASAMASQPKVATPQPTSTLPAGLITTTANSGGMMPTIMKGQTIYIDPAHRTPKRGDLVAFKFPGYLCEEEGRLVRSGDQSCADAHATVEPQAWVKRVVALPGDRISMQGEVLSINGQAVEATMVGAFEGNPGDEESRLALEMGATIWTERLPDGDGGTVQYRTLRMPNYATPPALPNVHVPMIVAQGCYLVMGDSRDNSTDSRWFGCAPRQNILGIVHLTERGE